MPGLLITGGAGFIGTNAAAHFAGAGWRITLLDNLARPGARQNLAWIRREYGPAIDYREIDVRDRDGVNRAVDGQSAILHLAAQVAVTASLDDPVIDFDVNAGGTLTLLEAVRRNNPEAVVIYASTNKVYGALSGRGQPVGESQALDFQTPYGCSKGAADQYVRDYGRVFGLRTIVLRQSCIYGAHQFGSEDQGWVAHFVHSAVGRRPIVIYGDGHQVRDLLDVRDLCRLFELTITRADDCRGMIFNVGGGPANARSVLQVVDAIERITGTPVARSFGDWRPGDQHYYVSDLDRIHTVLGWTPDIDVETGLTSLVGWASSLKAFVRAA